MNIQKATDSLQRNGYTVKYFEKAEEAAEYLDKSIDGKTVGFGDSATLTSLRLYERLTPHNRVVDPQNPQNGEPWIEAAKKCFGTEIYVTSVNALSETGELVNIDGTGNRIAASLFGHQKVYFVAGTNKLAPTLEDAIWRARNVAAPMNCKRWEYKTPCAAEADQCYDCSGPDRPCNAMVIHLKKMKRMEMEVVLINEKLGF